MDSFEVLEPTQKLAAVKVKKDKSGKHQGKQENGKEKRPGASEHEATEEGGEAGSNAAKIEAVKTMAEEGLKNTEVVEESLDSIETEEPAEILSSVETVEEPTEILSSVEAVEEPTEILSATQVVETAVQESLSGIEVVEESTEILSSVEVVEEPTEILGSVEVVEEPTEGGLDDEVNFLTEEFLRTFNYHLTIVIPTRNERDNIEPLLRRLKDIFVGIRIEIIFVDDSDDETPDRVKEAALTMGTPAFHIHLEHRTRGPERAGGLATAVTLGLQTAQGRYAAVIDADLQHPPAQLRVLYDEAIKQDVDLVIGSRYIKGGSAGGLDGMGRLFFSVGLKMVAKLVFPGQLSRVSDPLSGFFLLKRSILKDVTLRPIGYKILLEILLRCPWQELAEVPYRFQRRQAGQSKADFRQGFLALQHMVRLFRTIPAAGRVWKVSALLLFNLAVLVALFFAYPFTVSFWQPFSLGVFGLVALLNYLLLSRFIFPANLPQPQSPSPLVAIDEALTVVTPAVVAGSLSQAEQDLIDDEATLPRSATSAKRTLANALLNSVDGEATLPRSAISAKRTLADTLLNEALSPAETEHTSPATAQAVVGRKRIKRVIRRETLFMVISTLLALTTMGMVGYMALDVTRYALPNAWVILAALLFGLSLSIATSPPKINVHRIITTLLAVSMGITFVDYLSWRVEVINWAGWWLALPLLFAEFLGAIHTMGLQFTLWPRAQPVLKRSTDPTHSPIFIFIPTVNEGVSILEPSITGALTARDRYLMQYPWGKVEIVLCNDGYVANVPDWHAIEALADRMGIKCVTRKKPGGAKAGNIENARQLVGATGDAFVVIFDADQVAGADFLLKTVPNMADPQVGWVQTGQYYRNLDNPVTRWADDQQSMFYNLLCPGKATWNAAFICGTNVLIRAQALDEIGGLPQDSVTEDFAASINLHTRWQSVYLTDILATGLGPMDLSAYLKQQRRWAIGTLGVLRTHWRDIALPKKNGLRLGQRLQYFLACTHYLCGLRDLLYLICPILFIFSGVPAVQGSTLGAFLWHFLPYFLVSFATIWYAGRGITGLRGIIIGFGCFPVLLESIVTVIFKRKVGFAVTSKKRAARKSGGYLWVYIMFALLCIAALIYSSRVKARVYTALFISLLWVTYTLILLCCFLWLYFLDWRKQKAERQVTHAQPERYVYPARFPRREQGLRSARNVACAGVLAAFIFLAGTLHWYGPPASTYPLLLSANHKPYLGVSLPVTVLKQKPTQLQQELGASFAIVGRTQDVSDFFDVSWADNLATHNARPWITLQFGSFQANGKPANDASLLSIAHGLHDVELTRWAESIRSYGKPVFITILLQADRNWSLSSAVANGGIPEDVPIAWAHVESLFRQMGANNVSWLWEPADPLHDQPYAPAATSIDGVVLDLISYPHTKWGNPQAIVRAVTSRYPGKPIIMQVSAAGPANQKAAWLSEVGVAAESNHDVYALIYHDASPALTLNAALDKPWSMTSDPKSLAVMRQIAAQLEQ